jgi:hypothetical protein
MLKNMPKLGVVLIVVVMATWMGALVTPALAQRARVPQTGQTTLYAEGDDGDMQAGVEWPTPRFTNRGNGTVRDNLTGLLWLQDVDCGGNNKPWLDCPDLCEQTRQWPVWLGGWQSGGRLAITEYQRTAKPRRF